MKATVYFLLFISLLPSCVPVGTDSSNTTPTGKVLRYSNTVYEDNIKTVRLHPFMGNIEDEVKPAIISIEQDMPLLLTFDQLASDYDELNVKIIHCNRDWQPSTLRDNEYLFQFNEFPLREYEFSFNTRTQYTHYRFTVPKVKLTGNYLLVVYRENNPNDIILSERFMVFKQLVGIAPEVSLSDDIASRNKNQEITFRINYSNLEIINPFEEVDVAILQNGRWDNAITTLKPTFVREDQRILEYEHFNLENNFKGGNEFRFFDLRTTNAIGQNVSGIEKKTNRVDAFIMRDKDRGAEVYAQYNDINGEYVINNLESSPPQTASDYVNVHFFLETPDQSSQNVYIAGELSNWDYTADNLMYYDGELGGYTGTLLLKQGWYNYLYYIPEAKENPYLYEGSHYETENRYEFLVYYRPPGSRADQIIGYQNYNYNERRN